MCAIGPGSFARGENLYYKTDEEFVFAAADAMHEEYKAIVDAGLPSRSTIRACRTTRT